MAAHKSIDRICCLVLAAVLVLTVVFMGSEALGVEPVSAAMGYEERLFDTGRVHTIDIVMDDWEGFIDTCENEEYALCSVVIDGEASSNVGLRAKGNTSLSQVKNYGNDRYSFKIEFDHYDSGKSYYGLDKLSLNNIIQDNTYMKDYVSYRLMAGFGVAAPLCSYAYITVNGEDWGLYLAVEGVEDAFLRRNYGLQSGELYKPDSQSNGGGRGNGGGFQMSDWRRENMADGEGTSDEAPDGNSASGEPSPPSPGAQGPDASAQPEDAPDGVWGNGQDGFPGDKGGRGPMGQDGQNGPPDMEGMPDMGEMPDGFQPPEDMPDDFGGPGDIPDMQGEAGMADAPETSPAPNGSAAPDNSQRTGGMDGRDGQAGSGGKGGFGGQGGPGGSGSSDVSLIYTDDEHDSYQNIWDNAKTDITDQDKDRLIASLKQLNEGEDVSEVVDVEQVIRYFVVHNFLCNFDSYTGNMIHNYYLYEEDGVLSMIPWDYNLAFGGFMGAQNAASLVNYSIDQPVSGGTIDSRPMLAWIFASEEYTELYHQYFSEFIAGTFESGSFTQEIVRVREMIAPYVEKDPTKFCGYDEFLEGSQVLEEFCELRAQGIRSQLDGGEAVDTGDMDLSSMGGMNNGMGGPGGMDRSGQQSFQRPEGNAPVGDAQHSETTEPTATTSPDDEEPAEQPDGESSDSMEPPSGEGQDGEGMEPPDGEAPGGGMGPPDGGGPGGDMEPPDGEGPGGEDMGPPDGEGPGGGPPDMT